MEVVTFEHAIASRDDGAVVIALFGNAPLACVAIVKCSEAAARLLLEELGSVLNTGGK